MKPHKHAELIKAWADGAEIEALFFNDARDNWTIVSNPAWSNVNLRFRIKPEPKPDFYGFMKIDKWKFFQVVAYSNWIEITKDQEPEHNLKITFDGETGKPKSVEVLK
jgi:hypothetical protein